MNQLTRFAVSSVFRKCDILNFIDSFVKRHVKFVS